MSYARKVVEKIRRKIISEKHIPRAVWLVFSTAHLVLVLDTKQNKEVYFLYFGKKENYLSLIPPENWKKEFIGAFRLNSEYKWEQVDWKSTT